MFRTRIFIVLVLVSFLCFPGRTMAQGRDELVTIQWPSREFPTIQSALDALPDGGVLEIDEGEYFVEEPISVTGKRVIIKGAGSGVKFEKDCEKSKLLDDIAELDDIDKQSIIDEIIGIVKTDEKPFTHLVGPPPQPVLDKWGNLLLPAQDVEGLFNFTGATGVVTDVKLSGFDAGIAIKGDGSRERAPVMIENVHICDTGRGILSLLSDNEVIVCNTTIQDTLWNGISVVGQDLHPFVFYSGTILNTNHAGLFFKNTEVCVNDVVVYSNEYGGILAYNSWGNIANSKILDNNFAGIALYECPSFQIILNKIVWNNPLLVSGFFGDGITLMDSQNIDVLDNFVAQSARAGLSNFWSFAALANNKFQCAGYELEGENYMGKNYQFVDNGGNGCGCPTPDGACVVESAGLSPPEPAAPIE
jgi:hypothetical protein